MEWVVRLDSLPSTLGWTLHEGRGCGSNNAPEDNRGSCKVEIICDDEQKDEIVQLLIEHFKQEQPQYGDATNPEGANQGIITVETIDEMIKLRDHVTWGEPEPLPEIPQEIIDQEAAWKLPEPETDTSDEMSHDEMSHDDHTTGH